MNKIYIDPTKSRIAVQVSSQSVYVPVFEISVYEIDAKTVIEQFTGDTKINNTFVKTLKIKPSECNNHFISGIFKVKSLDGRDFNYSIVFSILEDDKVVEPFYTLTGSTDNGTHVSVASYLINYEAF
jgi:hypothetical protein